MVHSIERKILMKWTLATASVLLITLTASAASFTWSGATNSTWNNAANWTGSPESSYPGDGVSGVADSALINVGTNANPIALNVALSQLSTLTLNAESANAANVVDIQANGSLSTSSYVYLFADSGAANHAKIINAGTFSPNAMFFVGSTASLGHAILDANQNVTVATDMYVYGFADITPASGKTVTVTDDIFIDAETGVIDTRLQLSDAGSLSADLVVVTGDQAGSPADVAELEIASGFGTFSPAGMQFIGNPTTPGYCLFDADDSVTVGASGTLVSDYVDFEIGSNVTFDADDLVLDSNGADLEVVGANSISKMKVDSLTTNVQPMGLIGPIVLEHN
jgi:hypothetical protein